MEPLALALASALTALLPPVVRSERAPYVADLAVAIDAAAAEATCSGEWRDVVDCRRTWPGSRLEAAVMGATFAYFETGLLPRIQEGICHIHQNPRPECDGAMMLDGVEVAQSVTAFQIKNLSTDRRREVIGLEPMALYEASREAMRVLSQTRQQCRWERYWSVSNGRPWAICVWDHLAGTLAFKQSGIRTATMNRLLARTRAELAQMAPRLSPSDGADAVVRDAVAARQ